MPSAWPDVMVLERPGPGLPIEAVDPEIGDVDPLALEVHSDQYQRYVRLGALVPAVAAVESAVGDLGATIEGVQG